MTPNSNTNDDSTFTFRWGAATDIGKVREQNEDTYLGAPEIGLFGVVDGMGGHAGGDIAARLVADDFPAMVAREHQTMRTRQTRAVRRWLGKLIAEQSRQLCFQGLSRTGCEGMGATLAMIMLLDGRVYAGNLGDSRVYHLRDGRFVQLSQDHSVIAELLAAGQIDTTDVSWHPARGQLVQYLGMPSEAEPHVASRKLKDGDRFLLCTDGLTDMVGNVGIREVLEAGMGAAQSAESLVQLANAAGGMDNTTVLVVDWIGLE
jgi:protein phosphatase